MRAFISLNLSEETKDALKEIQKRLKETLGDEESRKVKWEESDKFHITMFFIGEIDDIKADKLKEGLKEIRKENIGILSLETGKMSAFPNPHKPRVLITEVTDGENKLDKLSVAVKKLMSGYGYEQTGTFRGHITLGRVRRDKVLCKINDINSEHKNSFAIKEIHLMKSTLNREGSEHRTVFSVEL